MGAGLGERDSHDAAERFDRDTDAGDQLDPLITSDAPLLEMEVPELVGQDADPREDAGQAQSSCSMSRICISSASPGCASSTKMGPVRQ
ncbi:MAG: hypothetical protein U0V56_12305 [Actinomycetota bacterium]